jgi:magnesium-protoporphyrin O-methyltransferase
MVAMAAAVGAHAAVAPLTRSGLGMQRNARGRRNGVCAALPVVELAAQALDQGGLAVMESDGMTGLQFAVASGGAIAALAAVLSLVDPEKRRQKQAAATGGDEKAVVRNYFNTQGFERWNRIYGETDDVNSVQLDIRQGHAQTVEKVLRFLNDRPLDGVTVCDAGCGTGSLSIPLALQGAHVYASDISSSMVDEAARRAEAALSSNTNGHQTLAPKFEARDLESITGKYDTVACLDVLIHYPQDKAGAMVQHLASLAENRLILSFAPYTLYYAILKRIGELFPGPSKATRAYLHAEADVEAALKDAGWVVKRREMTGTKFYFSRLLEAVPAAQAQ